MVGDERKLMEESNSAARNTNLARDIRDSLAGNFYRYRGSTYITEGINQVGVFVEAYRQESLKEVMERTSEDTTEKVFYMGIKYIEHELERAILDANHLALMAGRSIVNDRARKEFDLRFYEQKRMLDLIGEGIFDEGYQQAYNDACKGKREYRPADFVDFRFKFG
jgi:hypothetical protein